MRRSLAEERDCGTEDDEGGADPLMTVPREHPTQGGGIIRVGVLLRTTP